jgi:hypothetical protein
MSAGLRNGLWLAVLHTALVGALGAKLMVDRITRPRVWVRAAPVDPSLPIRGRYVSLRLEAELGAGLEPPRPSTVTLPSGAVGTLPSAPVPVSLAVERNRLIASPPTGADARRPVLARLEKGQGARLESPVAYFIPEHAADPSSRPAGEQLWVEVTLPRQGAPRPIRLGVRKDGVLTPLDLH